MNIICVYIVFRALWGAWRLIEELFIIKEKDLSERYGRGSWALITGASDGIGLEFAHQLAKRGFNIVMAARNMAKMTEKEELIKVSHPGCQIKKVEVDFSDAAKPNVIQALLAQVKNLDIGLLVNNVGVSQDGMGVLQMPLQKALDVVTINCIPQIALARHFLAVFQRRGGRSAIIDVSSISAVLPIAGAHLYSGTKRFNRSAGLGHSMNGDSEKVDYLILKPGFVQTNLVKMALSPITCTTDECVAGALKALGTLSETFGSVKHIVFGTFIQMVLVLVPKRYIPLAIGLYPGVAAFRRS